MANRSFAGSALLAAVLIFCAFAPAAHAAYKMKILHAFCGKTDCIDGAVPLAGLIMDGSGNLLGTTGLGGRNNGGLAFELVPNAAKTAWTYKVIHYFCAHQGCTDGSHPRGKLVLDVQGNLYGITYDGGRRNIGAAYMLSPAETGQWPVRPIYSFCPKGPCDGGYNPNSGLAYPGMANGALYDAQSPLFGTTIGGFFGGAFALTPRKSGKWKEQSISSFCEAGDCGYLPEGGIAADLTGHAYGTTWSGGSGGDGVVFQSAKTQDGWSYTVLHGFDGAHGEGPRGALTMNSAGHLFGTTTEGGTRDAGVLYELVPNGTRSQFTVLHEFCFHLSCDDGMDPEAGPALDAQGNVYGTTTKKGENRLGTVYKYEPATKTFSVIYNFCSQSNCNDGQQPAGELLVDAAGNIYGTTQLGGSHGAGVIFELSP